MYTYVYNNFLLLIQKKNKGSLILDTFYGGQSPFVERRKIKKKKTTFYVGGKAAFPQR